MTWLTFSIFLDHAAEFPALQRDIRSISIQNNSNIRFGKKPEAQGKVNDPIQIQQKYKYKYKYKQSTNNICGSESVKQDRKEEVNDLIKRRCFLFVFNF